MGRPVQATTLTLAVALAGTVAACRTSGRGLRVGSATASVGVTLANMQPGDQNKADWVYELSGCDALPTLNGTLAAGATPAATNATGPVTTTYGLDAAAAAAAGPTTAVTFTAAGLKVALPNCQLRVKALQLDALTIPAFEPNVLYWTRQLDITENADGALVATAALQQVYSVKPSANAGSSFTIVTPVKFAVPEAGAPVTGSLQCGSVLYIGVYAGGTDASHGTFTFTVSTTNITDLVCSDLYVDVNGVAHVYHGVLSAAEGKIHGTPGQPNKLQEQTLTATAPPAAVPPASTGTGTGTGTGTAPATGVDVNTTDGGVCAPPKIYDSVKRTCSAP